MMKTSLAAAAIAVFALSYSTNAHSAGDARLAHSGGNTVLAEVYGGVQ